MTTKKVIDQATSGAEVSESVDQIPWVWQTPSKIAFDYQELQRFNLSLQDLPAGSQIVIALS